MTAGPSQEEVRRQNLGALLRYVHRHGAMTRAELTSRLGLNRSTIGALTADLVGAGLVTEETSRRAGRAGRPSLVVSARSDAVWAYALTIEVDRVRAARVGLGGVVLDQRETGREPGRPVEEAVAPLAGFVAEMQAEAPADTRHIGTGAAVSGRVRAGHGAVAAAVGLGTGWLAEPIRAALAAVLPDERPVTVGAAADLAALAEHARGVAVGFDNVIYLHGDLGIAAGIIAGGNRVSGYRGSAGEVGHMVVHPEGRRCGCGSRGCWETEVGERALLRAAGREDAAGREVVREVVAAAVHGDTTAQTAIRQVAEWLGFGVGNLVNIFNPEMVIFGDALRDIYLAAAAPLRSRLNAVGLTGNLAHIRLRTPALGDDAVLIGAAELAFEELLADPLDAG